MKKSDPNFKILTKQEKKNTKGGQWMSGSLAFRNNTLRFCPPPEPIRG